MGMYSDIRELSTEDAHRIDGIKTIGWLCKGKDSMATGLLCLNPFDVDTTIMTLYDKWDSLTLQERKDIVFAIRSAGSLYVKSALAVLGDMF